MQGKTAGTALGGDNNSSQRKKRKGKQREVTLDSSSESEDDDEDDMSSGEGEHHVAKRWAKLNPQSTFNPAQQRRNINVSVSFLVICPIWRLIALPETSQSTD